jgi:hypothetical protein
MHFEKGTRVCEPKWVDYDDSAAFDPVRTNLACPERSRVDAATFAPCLAVELDDSSHLRADRRERDAFVDEVLASVGIPSCMSAGSAATMRKCSPHRLPHT